MNVELLYGLKSEMDRIYINGMMRPVKNNPHVMKVLSVLEGNVGDDVAYLNLHTALKKLTAADYGDPVDVFSAIYTWLNYLLRLHGDIPVSGEERVEQEPTFNMDDIAFRQHSFSELKPLMDALKEGGKNRLEVIRKAREQNLFEDIRLYPLLDRALADEQPEFTELIGDIIKNDVGDKICPFLLGSFECNNKGENLKRLELLCDLKYEGVGELLEEIWKSDAIDLQAKVIERIFNDVAYEGRLIELSESPQKLFREKALLGLADLKTEKAEKKLCELYARAIKKKSKGDMELLVRVLSQTGLLYTFDAVMSQSREVFNSIIVAPKKVEVDLFNCLRLGILVLKRQDRPEVYDFLFDILFSKEYNAIVDRKKQVFAKPAKAVSYAIIDVFRENLDTERLMMFYERVIGEMEETEWKSPFYKIYLKASVCRGDSAERIYDVFAPHYRNKSIGVEDIVEACGVSRFSTETVNVIDKRWSDQWYETLEHVDEEENIEALLSALDALEPASSERYGRELVNAGKKTKKYLLEITSMIMKRDLPDKYETVYSLVKHCHDQGASGSNALRQLPKATYWSEFPKEFAGKFQGLKNAPRAISAKIIED